MYEQPVAYPDNPAPRRGVRRRVVAMVGVGALLAGGGLLTAALAQRDVVVTGSGSALALPSVNQPNSDDNGSSGSDGSTGNGSTTSVTTSATVAQQVGVVDINTVLGYQSARAAGTGMILTSTGEVLTNNHVINGATSISVTVVSTGKTYPATVVGTDPTEDVAVIQLQNASGLQTANIGDSSTVDVGETVTGVGNAGGVGGTPSAASGTVEALNQSITASDESGQDAETLTGLIETNAQIVAGDSGGPLYDSSGKIVGMDTAASSNGRVTNVAYAIPINHALAIADQIETGTETSTIHIGNPGFLGVSVADTASGAAIASVVANGPAAKAGLAAGDVITAINGTKITSATSLHNALSGADPGQTITVTWTDSSGQTHHASVTLSTGPAD
jgi:S1-C subfamily serine protease